MATEESLKHKLCQNELGDFFFEMGRLLDEAVK